MQPNLLHRGKEQKEGGNNHDGDVFEDTGSSTMSHYICPTTFYLLFAPNLF